MRALNSHVLLVDLHSHHHVPTSTLSYLRNSHFISSLRRRSPRTGIRCTASPEIRRPSDRFYGSSPSTSRPEDLNLFLELLPLKMRRELYRHREIGGLIEIVMDLGRKPLARFPSGDWVISEQPIAQEDLRHAISKVMNCCCVSYLI